jgi:hypothetical protein
LKNHGIWYIPSTSTPTATYLIFESAAPKLSFINEKIAFVDLSTVGKLSKGRGVVALAPITAGEVLVREEAICSAPFAAAEPNAGTHNFLSHHFRSFILSFWFNLEVFEQS